MSRHPTNPLSTISQFTYSLQVEGAEEGRTKQIPNVIGIDEVLDALLGFFEEMLRKHAGSILEGLQPKFLRKENIVASLVARVVLAEQIFDVGSSRRVGAEFSCESKQEGNDGQSEKGCNRDVGAYERHPKPL